MRTYCKCGWSLNAMEPTRLKCGKCGRLQWVGVPGLGDHIAGIIDRIGGRQLKRLYRSVTGRECGCKARQAWLNRLGERVWRWIHA